jgi:hypothetical protein
MEVEQPVHRIEHIDFCQSHPVGMEKTIGWYATPMSLSTRTS